MPIRSCLQVILRVLFIMCFGGIFTLMQKSSVQWDYLVYTQMWPQALCIQINETQPSHQCVIPDEVKSWTVHGLWPSVNTGKGPFYCNDSWPFRPDEIKDIQPDLERHWPNLIPSEGPTSFWKHEWTKHGTCAASLPDLDSEHKYFSKGLELQQRFNLDKIFSQVSIRPSPNKTYTFQDIRSTLEKVTKTYSRILCMEAKTRTEQIIAQIEICFDKEFNPIDCDRSKFTVDRTYDNPRFTRLKRSTMNTEWDPYPYFPQFGDCLENLPVRYLPISPGRGLYKTF